MNKNFTKQERLNIVVDLYVNQQKSINEISKELKIGWDTVKRDLQKANIEIISKRNKIIPNTTVRKDLFEKIETEEDAYWLGFLYADGTVGNTRDEIKLELQEQDLECIENFHKYCENKNKIYHHVLNRNGKQYISNCSSFTNSNVKQNLIKLGCVPNKSLILTCPTEQQVPQNLIQHFARGYIDGDGHLAIDKRKGYIGCIEILGTKDFLLGLANRMNWNEITIDCPKNKQIYRLRVRGGREKVNYELDRLYENSFCFLRRKKEIYLNNKLGICNKQMNPT